MTHNMNQHSAGPFSDPLNNLRHSNSHAYPPRPPSDLTHSQKSNHQLLSNSHQFLTSPLDYHIQQPTSNNPHNRVDLYPYIHSKFSEPSSSHPQSSLSQSQPIQFQNLTQASISLDYNQPSSIHLLPQYQDNNHYPNIGQALDAGSTIDTPQTIQQFPQIVSPQIHPNSNYINSNDNYSNTISPTLHAQATIAQATVTADKSQDLSRSKDPTTLMSRMYVGGIDMKVITKDQLIDAFRIYGRILDIKLHNHFAFVQFDNPYSCMDAIYSAQGTVINGHTLKLQLSSDGQRARNEFLASKSKVPLPPDPKDLPPNIQYPNPFKGQGQQLPAFLAVAETPSVHIPLNTNQANDSSLVNRCNTAVPMPSASKTVLTHSPVVQIQQLIQRQLPGQQINLQDQPQMIPTLVTNPVVMNPNASSQLQKASATIGIDAATLASIIGSFPIASNSLEDSKALVDPILPLMDLKLGGSQNKLSELQSDSTKDTEVKKHKKESKKKKRSDAKREEKKLLSASKKAKEDTRQKKMRKKEEELNIIKAKFDASKTIEPTNKEKSSRHHLKSYHKKIRQSPLLEKIESKSNETESYLHTLYTSSHDSKKQFKEHKDKHSLRSSEISLGKQQPLSKLTTLITEKPHTNILDGIEKSTLQDDSQVSKTDSEVKIDKDIKHDFAITHKLGISSSNIKKYHKNSRSSSPILKAHKRSKLSRRHSRLHSHATQKNEDLWDEYAYYYDVANSNSVQKLQKDYYTYYVNIHGYDFNHWNTEFEKYLENHPIDAETKEMVMNLRSLMSSYPSYYSDNYYTRSHIFSSQQYSDNEQFNDIKLSKEKVKYQDLATSSQADKEKQIS